MPRTKDPSTWLTRTCPRCESEFQTPQSWPRTYCSNDCYRAQMAERRVDTTCPQCGKAFWYHRSWPRVYCSNECAGKANVANIRSFAPTAYTATCEVCGKQFTTTPAVTRGRFCSSRCWGKWLSDSGAQSGTNSPNWRGGKFGGYYGANWSHVRRVVRERDGVCQDCGISPAEYGSGLDVHHIVPFRDFGVERYREANRLDNLVALCRACHMRREFPDDAGG